MYGTRSRKYNISNGDSSCVTISQTSVVNNPPPADRAGGVNPNIVAAIQAPLPTAHMVPVQSGIISMDI